MTSRPATPPRARLRAGAVIFAAALVAVSAGPASAADAYPRIVNGLNTHDFPATGALLYSQGGAINENNAGTWCSGTLIGCSTFLTAAHCVEGDITASHYWVYLQHAGIVTVQSIAQHPSYVDASFPIDDVAVIKLASPVTGIEPQPINLQDPVPFIPASGTVVGFGQTSGNANDYGIKRYGAVDTASCPSGLPAGAGNTEVVCWKFQNPVGPAGTDSNTCNGDSGGPLFLDLGAGEVVAGTTSGGTSATCQPTDNSYDANVYTYRNFINSQLGADSMSVCGGLPAVGIGQVTVIGNDGNLSSGTPSDSFTVNVGTNVNVLRFALNGEDNGSFDVDFYVKEGLGAGPSDFNCKADGNSDFGSCEFMLPNAGDWSVYVQRASGSGEYQVTTTIFGGDPPVCGNDVLEFGEECDGTDSALCQGLCQGDCTCPAPVCGNDVVEQGEQCDGTNPGACPIGVCDPDCTCQDPVCGNDVVEEGEDCDGISDAACPGNCIAPGGADECRCDVCGNGTCDLGEDETSCPADCGCAAAGACGTQAPAGCFCDIACTAFGDCCPDACSACSVCASGACGNGVLDDGEQCDDGNAVDGDCCASDCSFEAADSPCDDGSICSVNEACDGAGRCVGDAQVATGCLTGERAIFQIKNKLGNKHDRITWKLRKGEETLQSDFGTPSSSTTYDLCVFDYSSGAPRVAAALTLEPTVAWTSRAPKGWLYKDKIATSDGFRRIKLLPGGPGKTKLDVDARGTNLPTPVPIGPSTYLDQDPQVTVQLVNSDGRCWSSDFTTFKKNAPDKFKATGP